MRLGRKATKWTGYSIACCLLLTWVPALSGASPHSTIMLRQAPEQKCGRTSLFARAFSVEIFGSLNCKEARKTSGAPCRIHLHQEWSCFSYREDKPFIVWFLSEELFMRQWSKAIVFGRYPCTKARVTPGLFARRTPGFPTRRQLLADDLIRCDLLMGRTLQEVEAKIGRPDRREHRHDRLSLVYWLGPERDTIFQVDDEGLLVEFVRGDLNSVSMFQG